MSSERTKQLLRGITVLIPLLIIVVLLLYFAKAPHSSQPHDTPSEQPTAVADSLINKHHFSNFDPNEASYIELVEAGVERRVAVSIIRWRESGKVYRIKEDIALCYGMTDSLYLLLEPYIIIGKEYAIKPKNSDQRFTQSKSSAPQIAYEPFLIDTVSVTYLSTIGFSVRQAEVVVNYREAIGGITSMDKFRECYVVDDEVADRLEPYIIFSPVDVIAPSTRKIDINSADSATLVALRGIGPKSAQHIIRYRNLLGGYHKIEQILELECVTTENFNTFSQQIYADTARIEKIYINFARPKQMEVHPYITNRMLKRIINHRELKGGWSTIEEMTDANIMSEDEAMRIAPYLDFGTQTSIE
ncbi:MAG: helix-hairpin-helix domain-containing protein [Alistipes sp.]|nr:helix-hairpin-helix domain-containing protein [Alistipes sp.]